MSELIGRMLGHYRVLGRLGAGGMGEVYRAWDERLARDVAVKVLPEGLAGDPLRVARFEREARASARVSHPNLIEIFDFGIEQGVAYAVIELLEGHTVRAEIEGGAVAWRRVVEVGAAVADGLTAVHAAGIVHRDLKPENIFVCSDGRIKILDLGLARMHEPVLEKVETMDLTPPLTDAGTVMGTVGYMSPELVRGEMADDRSDVFSLGCVIYEMLAGRPPYARPTAAEVMTAILRDDPPAFAELHRSVPKPLEKLVRRCLEKRRGDRCQSAHDLALALRAIGETVDWSASSPDVLRPSRWRRLAAAALALTAAASLAIWGWRWAAGRAAERATVGMVPVAGGRMTSSAPRHVAVLPFVAVGGEAGDAALAAGLGRVLGEELVLLEEQTLGRLWVVPGDRTQSLEQVRRDFNVNAAITGRLQVGGGRVRVEIAKVTVPEASILGSAVVDSEGGMPGSLQLDLVERAAGLLAVEIDPRTRAALEGRCTSVERAFADRVTGLGLLAGDVDGETLERATSTLERATREDPAYLMARVSLAAALLRRFHATRDRAWLQRADAQARVAADQDPPSAEAFRVLAEVCRAGGRTEDAVAALERATRVAPESAQAHLELAVALREAGHYDEAERAVQKAINLRPGYAPSTIELGYLYYVTNRYDAAANQFRLGAEEAPLNVTAHNDLGGLMYFLGRRTEAREACEASLAAYPNPVAYSQLGTMFFDEADYARSADMFERAVELAPGDCQLAGNLATAYHWGGDRRRAGPALRRAVEVCETSLVATPDDPWLMANLAGYYGILGERRERGLELLRTATSMDIVDAQVLAVIGESYEDLGDRDRALEWLGKAVGNGVAVAQLERAPALDELRKDPRFSNLTRAGQR